MSETPHTWIETLTHLAEAKGSALILALLFAGFIWWVCHGELERLRQHSAQLTEQLLRTKDAQLELLRSCAAH